MFLTAQLLAKTSFFSSLVNKCRQVIKNQQPKASKILSPPPKDRQTNNNKNINKDVSHSSKSITANDTNVTTPLLSISSIDRPSAIASLSAITTRDASSTVRTTLEEKIGLPPRPKKPLTPFFRFLREQRPKVIAESPNLSTMEMVRLISLRWSETDDKIKKRLQDEYKREQQIFVEVRAKYEANMTEDQRAELKQMKNDAQDAKERRMMRKRIKLLGRPKKPASAFLRFLVQERAGTPQLAKQTYREWHQKVTEKWNRLSDKEKESFLQESRREMEAYKKEIVEWEENMVRLGNIDVVRHANLIDPMEAKSKGLKPIA